MDNQLVTEYARTLASLEGDAFQAEVCARLRGVILGFQDVPAKPQGDGGLDAFSHDGEYGYCCYGPEHNEFKTNQGRETGIVNKFCGDLRRLFELATKGRRLVRITNQELATILPRDKKLKQIKLIVNWFESHRIIGRIADKVVEYKTESACKYVDHSAAVVIIGPRQLAEDYAVDDLTITRARQRNFIDKVQERAHTFEIKDPKDFDWKIDTLKEIRPDQLHAIQDLADGLRENWRTALAFERELGDSAPRMHHALELSRRQIQTQVATLMLAAREPWTQFDGAADVATRILTGDFGQLYGPILPRVAYGEVARLIGECTIGWQKPIAAHGRL